MYKEIIIDYLLLFLLKTIVGQQNTRSLLILCFCNNSNILYHDRCLLAPETTLVSEYTLKRISQPHFANSTLLGGNLKSLKVNVNLV